MKRVNQMREEMTLSFIFYTTKQGGRCEDLLENLKGERTPDVSVAAHPKALVGCSCSADFAICFSCLAEDNE